MAYKTFTTNEILYPDEVNDYLMRQSNIVVADATERDTIPSPVEGLTVYREDLNAKQFYDGSNWITEALTPGAANVSAAETTTSTSYIDLTTSGASVTVIVPPSGIVKVEQSLQIANSVAGAYSYASVALSGANTEAAADNKQSTILMVADNNGYQTYSGMGVFEGLTPGSTTFTQKYRVSANTGSFKHRSLVVTPLP